MSAPLEMRATWRWVLLGLFALTIAMLGGSSRYDAAQLAALRPLAALFLIPALYFISAGKASSAKPLLWLLGLWALWTALQLVPLPPALWQALPGRDRIAELDALIGLEGIWRPLSLAPDRSLNALAGLIVPLTALMLALSLEADRRMLLVVLAMLGLIDGALGLTQVALGGSNALYFYSKTNSGAPVGLFANENHSAMFSALSMIVIAHLTGTARSARDPLWLRLAYAPGFLLALLSIFVGSSRFGLVLAVFSLALALYLAFPALRQPKHRHSEPSQPELRARQPVIARNMARPWMLAGFFLFLLVALFGGLYMFERVPGIEQLFRASLIEELRWQIWSTLEGMIGLYWLLGTGFGSFEAVYQIHEPTDLMRGAYLNQAHNDWAQLIIEGGTPACALVIAGFAQILGRIRRLAANDSGDLREFVFWLALITVICAASVVDYPLRTPLFQMTVAFVLLGMFVHAPQGLLTEHHRLEIGRTEQHRKRRGVSHRSRSRASLRA